MGGIFTKKEPEKPEIKQQDQAGPFYVETKLADIPKWAELEWEYSLRHTDMSMDQDNIDLAMDNLKKGERVLQDNKENFDKMVSNMEEEMLEMRISQTKHMREGIKTLEYEQIQMKEENEAIQNREVVLKEKENKVEEMMTTMESENILMKGKIEKIKIREEKLKEEEETMMEEQVVMKIEYQKIKIRLEEKMKND